MLTRLIIASCLRTSEGWRIKIVLPGTETLSPVTWLQGVSGPAEFFVQVRGFTSEVPSSMLLHSMLDPR